MNLPTVPQRIERYEQLIRVLSELPEHERTEHFRMCYWSDTTDCGTTHCAAGFAASDQWFRRRGFRLSSDKFGNRPFPLYGVVSGWSAVERFFDAGIPQVTRTTMHSVFDLKTDRIEAVIEAARWRIYALKRWRV